LQNRGAEGAWLGNLGLAYSALGQVEQARQVWQQALRIFAEIKSPTAATVRAWLQALDKE
jgi:hypothetical protein